MVKRLALWASACLLLFSLVGGILTLTVGLNARPGKVKHWLRAAHVYEKVPAIVLDQAAGASEQQGLSLKDKTVRKAAEQTLTSDFVAQSGDTIIDATGQWLTKATPTAEFHIDLLGVKEQFADKLIAGYRDRYEQLPFCNGVPESSDISKINCRLERGDFDIDQALATLRLQILEDESFLNKPTLSPETIAENSQNKTIYQIQSLPTAYVWFQRLPLIFGVLAALSALCVIALCESKRFGIRKIGWRLLVAGIITFVIDAIGYVLLYKLQSTVAGLSRSSMYFEYRTILGSLIHISGRDIAITLGAAAVTSILIGTVILVAVKDTQKNKSKQAKTELAPEQVVFSKPAADEPVEAEGAEEEPKEALEEADRPPKKHRTKPKRNLIQ